MASQTVSKFEELKELLSQLPQEIVKPIESKANAAKLEGVTKYVYPVLHGAFEHKVQTLLNDPQFLRFGKCVDELDELKALNKTNMSGDSREIGDISLQDTKLLILCTKIDSMKRKIQENNTEINVLMNEIQKKREYVKKINADLDSID